MSAAATEYSRQIPIVCPGHTRPLADLQSFFVPEEKRSFLVSACHDKQPMLRDGVTGDWIGTFSGHKGAVWSCRVDPTGNLAATAGGDFSVKLWDAITGATLRTWQHAHIVKAVAFPPAARWLATGGHEGLVRLYDLTAMGADGTSIGGDEPVCQIPQLPQQEDEGSNSKSPSVVITKLIWHSDSRLWVGCSDGTLRLWNVPNDTTANPPTLVQTLTTAAGQEIRDMEVRENLPDGSTRLTVAAGNAVYFYRYQAADGMWKFLKSIATPVHFAEEGGVSLHPAGHVFAVGGSALWVHVFDYETEQELDCLKGHHGPIRCVRYMEPDGNLFATGSEDGTIRLWKNQYPPKTA
uniref:Serine-threonine kinase receptor-associated protein n=1 Tax=Amphora coffeiformis TaxID=265554 RepID=A0A7S3LCH1_9STRA